MMKARPKMRDDPRKPPMLTGRVLVIILVTLALIGVIAWGLLTPLQG
jgi:hypothetical protein